MNSVIVVAMSVVITLVILFVVQRFRTANDRGQKSMFTTLEHFAVQMARENDRVIEMMAVLRQKIDQDILLLTRKMEMLQKQVDNLETRYIMQKPFQVVEERPIPEEPEAEFFSPKYKDVAKRLKNGEDPAQIANDLNLGRGEIDLVSQLIRQRRS